MTVFELFALTIASVMTPLAVAQSDQMQARYRAAFEAMMQDLGNRKRSFAFVRAAVDAGDLRGAIAALERVLLIKPDLANVKLELGLLYQAAGAPETAETYLAEARASGQVPPEYEARLARELDTARAAQSRHRLTGSLFVGGRYETNANAGPDSLDDLQLDEDDQGQNDISAVAALNLEHAYDLGLQSGDELVTDVLLYGNVYREVHDLDLGLIDVAVGPRLYRGDADRPLEFRPFVTGSLLWLGDVSIELRLEAA